MKGIILAGGRATRLYPITKVNCKQLLPVYDKPMIYYPLSVLLLGGIRDILIISTPHDLPRFQELLGNGQDWGIRVSYAAQEKPKGIAQAFIIAEDFIGQDSVCLILGDNIFYGSNITQLLHEAKTNNKGATIFGYYVKDPERYGVVTFDKKLKVTSIEEKPKKPKSNWAVTGLYFYDNNVVSISKNLKPSKRDELEITDVNKAYFRRNKLNVQLLGRGHAWLDTGTYDSLIDAALYIKTIEDRQGLKVGCPEEIAYRMGYIDKKHLLTLAQEYKTSYGKYLKDILEHEK
jgi:glucose-1-phosphate thymidylyltransferase